MKKTFAASQKTDVGLEIPEAEPGCLYRTVLWLYPEKQIHTRIVYNFLEMIGNLGGIYDFLI